jgi:dienelactone hydrolase
MQELLIYQADGLTMHGQLFFERGVKRAGVLVFPDAFGLNAHAVERARRLAAEGYVALACDLHGEGKIIPDIQQMMATLAPLMGSPERIRDRAGSALAALSARDEVDTTRLAAIGFCLGGTMAFELARTGADIRAAVGFHAVLETKVPAALGGIKASILACIGADDPMVAPDQRAGFEAEMRIAKADWQLHLYGGVVHSFTDPDAGLRNMPEMARYDETADTRSWAAMHGLFAQKLG